MTDSQPLRDLPAVHEVIERLPAALTQGLRDFFGAHTYGRIDADPGKKFHTLWSGDRSEVPA